MNNLIAVALLRADAARSGILEIDQKGTNLHFYLSDFQLERVSTLCAERKYQGRLVVAPGERPCIALRLKKGEDAIKWSRRLVEDYAATAPAGAE